MIKFERCCAVPDWASYSLSLRPEGLFCADWYGRDAEAELSTLWYVPLAGRSAGRRRDGTPRAAKTLTPTSIGRAAWVRAGGQKREVMRVLLPGERYGVDAVWLGTEGSPAWYARGMCRPTLYAVGPYGGLLYWPDPSRPEAADSPRPVCPVRYPDTFSYCRVGHDGCLYAARSKRSVSRVSSVTRTSSVRVTDAILLDFALTPDCRRMVTAEKTEVADNWGRTFATFHTRVYDLDWPRVTRVHEYTWPATRVAVSTDGASAVAVDRNGDVVIFDLD